jgi:hypothetical protein
MAQLLLANATPGGPVSPEVYAGEGVRFAAGSSLIQNNTAIANTSLATISLWMRCHTPPATSQFGPVFTITKPNAFQGIGFEEDFTLGVSSTRPGTGSTVVMGTKSYNGGGDLIASDGATRDLTEDGSWHHIFMTVDTTGADPAWVFYVDGAVAAVSNFADDGYPTAMTLFGKNIGFPASSDVLADPLQFGTWSNGYPADFSDVQIWFGQAINPATTQTRYTAKTNPEPSRIIRDTVNYQNSRGIDVVEALAAMYIETIYGTFGDRTAINGRKNLWQFLYSEDFTPLNDPWLLILGPAASNPGPRERTSADAQNRAFANAWSGRRPNGTVVAIPNDYGRVVRGITGFEPLGWEKYLMHILGGSVRAFGAVGNVNGYSLLSAYVNQPAETTLSQTGTVISNMTGQTKIWGSEGPIGTVTGATTVTAAINCMIQRWEEAESDALQYLDSGSVSNMSYFIDADQRAVPPYAARDKFGLQTFVFTGNAETFIDNVGTGGAMTLVGTVTEVSGPND